MDQGRLITTQMPNQSTYLDDEGREMEVTAVIHFIVKGVDANDYEDVNECDCVGDYFTGCFVSYLVVWVVVISC